jgi:hypothetical protein
MRARVWVGILAGVAGVVWIGLRGAPMQAPAPPDATVSFRLRLGVNDKTPRSWNGSVEVLGGEVVNLRFWRPRPGYVVNGKTSWTASGVYGPVFQRRAWEEELVAPNAAPVLAPGVIVDVRNATAVNVTTAHGNFRVDLSALDPGRTLAFLGGSVLVDRAPSAQLVSTPDYQDDFVTALSTPRGDFGVAWIGYRSQANEVFARHFNGQTWGPIQTVSEKPGDYFLVKVGRHGQGRVWAVWSAQVNGNWDLYGRAYESGTWSPTTRLTEDPQPDIYHNLATDSNGALWLVWQGFRNGKSDIFARRYDGASWTAAERVSTSPANDWEPVITAGPNGRVWVAWDTYDKGNYDVSLRGWDNGRWGEVIPAAATPKFEAHASIACDEQGRPWLAWNESGFNWGKDSGFLVKKEATRLYQWRSIGVAVYQDGQWLEPPRPVAVQGGYYDMPVLSAGGDGRMWLLYRRRVLRIPDTHNNTPAHRAAWEIRAVAYDGDHWSRPIDLPASQGRLDMRIGVAPDAKGGGLWAAWPTDNRDYEEFLFEHADVYAAKIPPPPGPARAAILQPRRIPEFRVFPVHTGEAGDLAAIRAYTIQSGGKTYRIYRGDTHRHTEFSMDGNNDGSLNDTYRYALDAASLDYLLVSDHNGAGGPDVEYINWLLQQAADLFTVPGTFTPFYGYERSVVYPNGHRNILFAKRGNPTLPIPVEEQKARTGAAALYKYLKLYNGIAISHTSATTMGTDWRDNDPEVEPLVEIYQGDRVSAEYEGAPKAANAADPASAPGGFRPAGYVWNAWAKGYKLGVQVASDHLSAHISYACTLAPGSTRQELLDAMKLRHSYGATDNIILDYRLLTGGKEYLQGEIVPASGDSRLSVKVIGTGPIRQIDVIRNNTFVHTIHPVTEKQVSFTWVDNQPRTGERYYYVRVIQANDQMAWSSPIWVR